MPRPVARVLWPRPSRKGPDELLPVLPAEIDAVAAERQAEEAAGGLP